MKTTRWFVRWRRGEDERVDEIRSLYNLSHAEFNQLATFNAEQARGLTHTREWREKMQELQERFNNSQRSSPPPTPRPREDLM